MKKFIFDVDGTLTPSRQGMNADFQRFFLEFCYDNRVYLVTGSDYPKTVEQLGNTICMNVNRVYNCNGNDVWEGGINVRQNEWKISDDARDWLSNCLTTSEYQVRTGLHFEHRPGMVNFSIVGRNANLEQRVHYAKWDRETKERETIAKWFNEIFNDLQATVGGETGLDIAPKGCDKSQILVDFDEDDEIIFFGDRMDEKGNDYPLARANVNGENYHVKDWKETRKILDAYINNRT